MLSRKVKLITASSLACLLGLGLVYILVAAQGQGPLAQTPLNNQIPIPPAFIMAVDDSGSMTFQTQFPGADGQGCWNTNRQSFFSSPGVLNRSGNVCGYNHVMIGPRLEVARLGIPPLDIYGFAKSSAYNPTYYNPQVKYDPWIGANKQAYDDADTSSTKIDPRVNATSNLVNLTSDSLISNWLDAGFMQDGMVIPDGRFFQRVFVNARGTVTGYGSVQRANGTAWAEGATHVLIQHVRSVFFMPYTSNNDPRPVLPGSPNAYNGVARIRVANACGQGCDLWKYTVAAKDTDALRNFANWFSFYGNRNRAMIAGMTRSFDAVEENLRVGYFRINQNTSFDSADERLVMRNISVIADRNALYSEMIGLTASGGTPNREAVNAAGIQFTRSDSGAPVQLACQKNAVMLFTDGFSNDIDNNFAAVDNADGDGGDGRAIRGYLFQYHGGYRCAILQ